MPRGRKRRSEGPDPDVRGPAFVEWPAPKPKVPTPPVVAEAPADPLAPVRVRNLGARGWSGTDFRPVGNGHVPAGGEGVVTRRKADELLAGKHYGFGAGVGPFEVVEE